MRNWCHKRGNEVDKQTQDEWREVLEALKLNQPEHFWFSRSLKRALKKLSEAAEKVSQWLWLSCSHSLLPGVVNLPELTLRYVKSCWGVSWGVSDVVSGSGMCPNPSSGWVWDARHHCWAFWRCRGANSTKHWWRKVSAWKPQWNAHKGNNFFLLHPATQVLWLSNHVCCT